MSKRIEDYLETIEAAWGGKPDENFLEIFKFGISTLGKDHPKGGFSGKGNLDEKYIYKIVAAYKKDTSRKISLNDVNTASDKAVEMIAIVAGKITTSEISKASDAHRWLMQSENILGTLLEKYIDSKLGQHGWLWCAGSFIKAVDFIFFDKKGGKYQILQVKNSNNSENSSSSAIREGTEIEKWFRRYANDGRTNWAALNAKVTKLSGNDPKLSEDEFLEYIKKTIQP